MNSSKTFEIDGRSFCFKSAPHLTDGDDWHDAYIKIIDRFLQESESQTRPTLLPAYPLRFDKPEDFMELLFEMGSYWEGALYFLCQVIGARKPIEALRQVENSYKLCHANYLEKLFMAIWNSHGQLKWLKAFLVRMDAEEKRLLDFSKRNSLLSESELYREAGLKHQNSELLWLSAFVLQHEDEGNKYPNPYFGGGNSLHLGVITGL